MRERVIGQTFGHDDVRQTIDQRNVGARLQLKVIVGFDMGGVRTRSIARGSAMISFAPSRKRCFIREANTGWPSVGLAPMIMITSA